MELKDYHKQITTAWQLFKAFFTRPYDDAFWNAYADALEDPAVREMSQTRFGMDLLQAVTHELERIKRGETNHVYK